MSIEIILIAIGLSMDSFCVAIANGIKGKDNIKFSNVLKISSSFAIFQFLMPLAGFLLGLGFKQIIESLDHWIAFLLLTAIGIKMIYESLRKDENKDFKGHSSKVLLMQSVATSIDALVIGISFAFLKFPIINSSVFIGITTFLFSFSGVYIGKKWGCILKNKGEIIGGLILIGIGLKILIQHLF